MSAIIPVFKGWALFTPRSARDGTWHLHNPIFGFPVMRRFTDGEWYYRSPTDEEETGEAASGNYGGEAWNSLG